MCLARGMIATRRVAAVLLRDAGFAGTDCVNQVVADLKQRLAAAEHERDELRALIAWGDTQEFDVRSDCMYVSEQWVDSIRITEPKPYQDVADTIAEGITFEAALRDAAGNENSENYG